MHLPNVSRYFLGFPNTTNDNKWKKLFNLLTIFWREKTTIEVSHNELKSPKNADLFRSYSKKREKKFYFPHTFSLPQTEWLAGFVITIHNVHLCRASFFLSGNVTMGTHSTEWCMYIFLIKLSFSSIIFEWRYRWTWAM